MILMGFDPGYDRLGWAVLDATNRHKPTIIEYGCILTDKSEELHQRYTVILEQAKVLIEKHHPQTAAIESLIFNTNKTTAIRVSEVRGLILSQLLVTGCDVAEYSPPQIKLAVTGYGRADKAAVAKMVELQFGLSGKRLLDDTIDALAVALTHALIYKEEI